MPHPIQAGAVAGIPSSRRQICATGLYPHTYAAGVACAVAVSEGIRAEGRPAVERWLETLGLGSSLPALELARRAGVEMTEPGYLRTAAALFGELVEELEQSYPDGEAAVGPAGMITARSDVPPLAGR